MTNPRFDPLVKSDRNFKVYMYTEEAWNSYNHPMYFCGSDRHKEYVYEPEEILAALNQINLTEDKTYIVVSPATVAFVMAEQERRMNEPVEPFEPDSNRVIYVLAPKNDDTVCIENRVLP